MSIPDIRIKRAYLPASPDDGFRVFVDRKWPRGLSHATFPYDVWDKAIAPSIELRKWFHEAPAVERWEEFEKLYSDELRRSPALEELANLIADKPVVTLLYPCRYPDYNVAVVVRKMLLKYFRHEL